MDLNIDKINRMEQQHIDELNRELPFVEREPFSKPNRQ
jgi:hypothetical protein